MTSNEFNNQQINLIELPSILDLANQNLAENYAPLKRLINLTVTLCVILICSVIYFQPLFTLPAELNIWLPYVVWIIAILGLTITWFNYLSNTRKCYALRELDLHYSSGVFFRKTVSQPVTRIQHMELKRGPIERKVGLATLQVFSAGGAMHTFEIPGLPLDTAQRLREFVLQHKDVVKHG